MGILPRRRDEAPAAPEAAPEEAPDRDEAEQDQATPPPVDDAGATAHPSRYKGDIYIESNDADNRVFEDPEVEEQARDELFDLAEAALRRKGTIKE